MNLIRRLKSKELSLLTIFKAISRPLIISQLTSVRDSNLSLRILFFFFLLEPITIEAVSTLT